jgi:hypothetical protein
MKRIFQRGPLFSFGTAGQCSRRSAKIGIVAGFTVIFLFFLQSGFSQNLNNFKLGSEPEGFGQIWWGIDVMTLRNFEYSRNDPSYGGIDIYRKPGMTPVYVEWLQKISSICLGRGGFVESSFLRKVFQDMSNSGVPYRRNMVKGISHSEIRNIMFGRVRRL